MLAIQNTNVTNVRKHNPELEKIVRDSLGENLDNELSEIQSDDGDSMTTKTTIISMHLAQMREWGSRGGGIRFKPTQDFQDNRKKFIRKLLNDNDFYSRYEEVISQFTARGEILWYYHPHKEFGYGIKYYIGGKFNPTSNFHVFYQRHSNDIECVVLLDVFNRNFYNSLSQPSSSLRDLENDYVLTFVTSTNIYRLYFEYKPFTDIKYSYLYWKQIQDGSFRGKKEEFDNEFGVIPAVLVKNKEIKPGGSGISDFDAIAPLLIEHNLQANAISENLLTFGNPTLISTRDKEDILDKTEKFSTWASQNGFKSAIKKIGKAFARVPKWITGIKQEERFSYLSPPDPVSGDMNNYFRRNSELAQWILGGVDPLGISASATFGEIKSLFGRIENTSLKKSNSLLGRSGVCKILEQLILVEENKCKEYIAKYLIQTGKLEFLPESIDSRIWQELYLAVKATGLDVPGLPPAGEITVNWQYSRRVFMQTTRDKLDESINARNMREDGMTQEAVLAELYPEKEEEEIRAMMSGFSPRVVQNDLVGIQGVLALYRELLAVANPVTGNPWALDLNVYEMINQAVLTLEKELRFNNPVFEESVPTSIDIIVGNIKKMYLEANTEPENQQSTKRK